MISLRSGAADGLMTVSNYKVITALVKIRKRIKFISVVSLYNHGSCFYLVHEKLFLGLRYCTGIEGKLGLFF